ncbi:hypothetical protein F4212_14915 [Candidatus Poribacteria bacterium]|nr:hypothetical protein [Candidatus Poribacteria bacterium]
MKKKKLSQALLEREQELNPQKVETPVEPTQKEVKVAPSRQKKRHISGYFSEDVHKQLRLIGFENDKSIQQMLSEALNMYFTFHDKSPIA